MDIKSYTIVVCSECADVWIVDSSTASGPPETTQCRRCGERHKFRTIKKCASVHSKEKAKLIRAKANAQFSGDLDGFEEAYENGELTLTEEEIRKGEIDLNTGFN